VVVAVAEGNLRMQRRRKKRRRKRRWWWWAQHVLQALQGQHHVEAVRHHAKQPVQ
jgi:hypothetical protein